MLEVEAKLAVPALAPVRAALRRAGAVRGRAVAEEDVFLAHPGRDLAARDEALRLRRAGGRLELTYKGPRQGSAGKARVEETVRLADDPTALLEALGFRPAARLRKRRQRWRLGRLEVALDEVEGLGAFVEVEAVGRDRAAAERAVEAGLRRLGLDGLPRLRASYLELALASGAAAATRL